ncbi:SRP19 protein [Toxoplasma gondii ME49]|uniref:SRP19 protein n=10 Tax=Toxoplasma gondii TaxID=5811 RepID=S7UNZ1_TOXGG|nr:SRP19 protein [Toxoplasma gondii ME49]EPR59455.1 SRP19 protein [Toxoplasma gondii GT1]KAF4643791.1 SRP19 protein [Toxoplasma gondii]KFG54799.1 SRP19 protein [Toxoplasma gondii FOU]KFG63218.1 SRP19 protein [Toxoplasma gondii RUB]KFH06408.1 SRP19 protein [Toxoplasma gondii MAS]KFH08423.1 SRP19 protein [Toxoplasma gondii VAND]KYF43801.1 SRP19 protein [Toxoplasma gondii ARI]PUA88077.1 SRP19 protein [Toxoplasma gondii TgCATBr9]RQX69752.1 SRP19 protein [Toxoplasma gondii CAST]|eukprot:XP_002369299.1 SRP19 protein [Toxoplasma gondii ME49]
MGRQRDQRRQGGGMPGGFPGGFPAGFPGGLPGGFPGGLPGGFPGGLDAAALGGMPAGLPEGLSPELLAQMLGGMPGGPSVGMDQHSDEAGMMQNDGVDRSRWQIVYPAYINKKRTAAMGRRVQLSIAVEDPKVDEMKKICDHFNIPAAIEYVKRYPRDWLLSHGRLRFQLKDENDQLHNQEIPNKKILMRRMCELIPQLKSRSTPTGPVASAASSTKKKKRK